MGDFSRICTTDGNEEFTARLDDVAALPVVLTVQAISNTSYMPNSSNQAVASSYASEATGLARGFSATHHPTWIRFTTTTSNTAVPVTQK